MTSAADLSAARDHLRRTLPETLQAVLDAYDAFAARPVPEDAKAFAAWQGGCKAALAHVELLLKLAGRVGLDLSERRPRPGRRARPGRAGGAAQAALDGGHQREGRTTRMTDPALSFPQFLWIWNHVQGRGTPAHHRRMADWLQAVGRTDARLPADGLSRLGQVHRRRCLLRLAAGASSGHPHHGGGRRTQPGHPHGAQRQAHPGTPPGHHRPEAAPPGPVGGRPVHRGPAGGIA